MKAWLEAAVADLEPPSTFGQLVTAAQARSDLLADAAHAASAVEHGATLISKDGDLARSVTLRRGRPPDL